MRERDRKSGDHIAPKNIHEVYQMHQRRIHILQETSRNHIRLQTFYMSFKNFYGIEDNISLRIEADFS